MRKFLGSLALASALVFPAVAFAAKIDDGHSGINFKAQHFGAGYTWGHFDQFEGTIDWDGDQLKGMDVRVKVASVDTGIEKRNKHLQGPDFFDAANHPEIHFKSTSVAAAGDGKWNVTGDMTLHGVTKSITVEVVKTGEGELPIFMGGGTAVGLETVFTIKMSDYGIVYDGVGDEVQLLANFEFKK